MKWLDDLKANINRLVGNEISKEVMTGSEDISEDSSPERLSKWFRGAVERLDKLADEETRKKVMMDSCPEQFPPERIQNLRQKYQETGDIDDLIRVMHGDSSWEGLSWYEYPERRGNSIFVKKIPFNPEGYEAAKDTQEKRYHYCHCRVVKAIMKSGEKMSPTFCYCGADWYRQLWEGILEKPVEVKVLKTVLQGDDACEFLIHLPLNLPK